MHGGRDRLASPGLLRHTALLASLILTSSLIYSWAIFLQNLKPSPRVSSPCTLPGPPLFPEFQRKVEYCHGLVKVDPLKAFKDPWKLLSSCESALEEVVRGSKVSPKRCETQSAWVPAFYRRNVLFIVDALRFSWLAWNTNDTVSYPYNAFHTPHVLLQNPTQMHHSRLFRAVADSPTMTTQRIRGLMMGDIPPFLDISKSALGHISKAEDSLPLQLQAAKRPFLALGDDTWGRLFESQLTSTLIDYGLNLHDYDSVDDGIHNRLWKLFIMRRDHADALEFDDSSVAANVPQDKRRLRADWDWIVAHALGSDHIGHDRGTENPILHARYHMYNDMFDTMLNFATGGLLGHEATSRILANIPPASDWQRSIGQLKDTLRPPLKNVTFGPDIRFNEPVFPYWDDTLLMLLGDHGMTDSGAHGGSSKDEVEAGWFVYSPKILLPRDIYFNSTLLRGSFSTPALLELTHPDEPFAVPEQAVYKTDRWSQAHGYDFRSIEQTDMTTTMALLTGLPIPSNAIGTIVPELIPLYSRKSTWSNLEHADEPVVARDSQGRALVSVIICTNGRQVGWPLFTEELKSHPAIIQYLKFECQWAFGSEVSYQSSDRVPMDVFLTANEGMWVIARLTWLRHLRLLIWMQHVQAWHIRSRIQEVKSYRPELFTSTGLSELWSQVLETSLELMLREEVGPGPILTAVDALDTEETPLTETRAIQLLEAFTKQPDEALSSITNETRAMELAWDRYRRFSAKGQRELRIVLSINQKASHALWLALVPMIGACCVFALRLVFLNWLESPIRRRQGFKLDMCILLGVMVMYICVILSGALPRWVEPGLILTAGIVNFHLLYILTGETIEGFIHLIRSMNSERVKYLLEDAYNSSNARPELTLVAGLLVKRDEGWLDLLRLTSLSSTRCKLLWLMSCGSNHLHIVSLVCWNVFLFMHGPSIIYPGILTRFMLQQMVLLAGVKSCTRVWTSPRDTARGIKSDGSSRRQLIGPTVEIVATVIGILVLLRLSDDFDIHYVSPKLERPLSSLKLNNPDVVAAMVAGITALLLKRILAGNRTWQSAEIFFSDFNARAKVNANDINHSLRHVLLPHRKLLPETSESNVGSSRQSVASAKPREAEIPPLRRRRRRQSDPGPSQTDTTTDHWLPARKIHAPISNSPEICCSSGRNELGSSPWLLPPALSTDMPFQAEINDHSADRIRYLIATNCVAQALIAALYFSACSEFTTDTAIIKPSEPHTHFIRVLAKCVGVPQALLKDYSRSEILRLLLPRAALLLSTFHFSCSFTYIVRGSRAGKNVADLAPLMMSLCFYLFLFLQDVSQAISFCIQAASIALAERLVTRVMTEGQTSQAELIRRISSPGTYFQQLVDRHSQLQARRTMKAFDLEMRKTPAQAGQYPHNGAPPGADELTAEVGIQNISSHFLLTDEEVFTIAYLLTFHLYWSTGHRSDFKSLPLHAGFVGLTKFGRLLSVFLIVLHCVAAPVLLPIVLTQWIGRRYTSVQDVSERVVRILARAVLLLCILVTLDAVVVYRERFNLPAWRDFAPKFIIDWVLVLVASAGTIVTMRLLTPR